MTDSFVIFLFLLSAIGLVAPSYTGKGNANRTLRNKVYYTLLVVILGSSPVLSLIISNHFGIQLSAYSLLNFLFVGFSLSLPASLLVARSGGRDRYESFWRYLEESSRLDQRTLVAAWVAISAVLAVLGALIGFG